MTTEAAVVTGVTSVLVDVDVLVDSVLPEPAHAEKTTTEIADMPNPRTTDERMGQTVVGERFSLR